MTLEQIKGLVGDLARPFAIISTSASAASAVIIISLRVQGFDGAAAFIAAVYVGVAALYGAKSWEVGAQAKQAANIEIAKATPAPAPDGTAAIVASPDVDISVRKPDEPSITDTPPWDRK